VILARPLDVDLRIEFVPLPAEKKAAWEYAMSTINELMDQAIRELVAEGKLQIDEQSITEYHVNAAGG